MHGDLVAELLLRVRKHEIVPRGEGNDALGQTVEPRPRCARQTSQSASPIAAVSSACSAPALARGSRRCQNSMTAWRRVCLTPRQFKRRARRRAGSAATGRVARSVGGFTTSKVARRSLQRQRRRAGQDHGSAEILQQRLSAASRRRPRRRLVVDQQPAATQDRFALPQAEKRIELGRMNRQTLAATI